MSRSSDFCYELFRRPSVGSRRLNSLTTPGIATTSIFHHRWQPNRSPITHNNFTILVWAVPFSLATTKGMVSFVVGTPRARRRTNAKRENLFLFLWVLRCFTSPGARPTPILFSAGPCGIPRMRFPYSDISGSKVACHLPEAFRRLLRPSSALHVEASTIRPYYSRTTETRRRPCGSLEPAFVR